MTFFVLLRVFGEGLVSARHAEPGILKVRMSTIPCASESDQTNLLPSENCIAYF